jgi:hypothetical protein
MLLFAGNLRVEWEVCNRAAIGLQSATDWRLGALSEPSQAAAFIPPQGSPNRTTSHHTLPTFRRQGQGKELVRPATTAATGQPAKTQDSGKQAPTRNGRVARFLELRPFPALCLDTCTKRARSRADCSADQRKRTH